MDWLGRPPTIASRSRPLGNSGAAGSDSCIDARATFTRSAPARASRRAKTESRSGGRSDRTQPEAPATHRARTKQRNAGNAGGVLARLSSVRRALVYELSAVATAQVWPPLRASSNSETLLDQGDPVRHLSGLAVLLLVGSIVTKHDAVLAEPEDAEASPAQWVYRQASVSVVVVEARVGAETSQGSGVVVGPRQIVTNSHVVRDAVGFVLVRQGDLVWRAEIENVDAEHDLALLGVVLGRTDRFDLPIVSRRGIASLAVGEKVYAIGSPRGLERTLTDGLISGIPAGRGTGLIQTSAAISPGSSGGGLFDRKGELVGITTMYLRDSQNLNFAVSTDDVTQLQRRSVRRANYQLSTPSTLLATGREASATTSAPKVDLPTALSTVTAVIVFSDVTGPVATAGGMTASWLRERVTARLRNHGIWVFSSREEAHKEHRFALPLSVDVYSMNIEDTVFYPWLIEISLMDTTNFTDGSHDMITVWNFSTYGYGGSKIVLEQVEKTIDESIDNLARKMAKP